MEHTDSEPTFRALITAACQPSAGRVARWYIKERPARAASWIVVRNTQRCLRLQGWKLHVSAGVACATAILRQVLPVLCAEQASFKVAASLQRLAALNDGRVGTSQIGKFITVYPHDDAQAVRLAGALDRATQGLRGPLIPSDRPLRPGSLVHYRYGSFVAQPFLTASGQLTLGLSTPAGAMVPDPRDQLYSPPAWVADPFEAAGVAADLPPLEPLLGGRYLVTALLYSSARGSVARAIDVATPQRCVLKRAGRDAMMQPDGRDARDRLRHEQAVLERLASPALPAVLDLFTRDADLILVLEDIQGVSVAQHVAQQQRQGDTLPTDQVLAWGAELAGQLAQIHAQGYLHRDLKSTNVLVTPTGQLRLIDLDIAAESSAMQPSYGRGTRGYMSPQQHAGQPPQVSDDIYGLGALLYYLATGAEPGLAPRPAALLDRPPTLLNPALRPALAQVIERCLEPAAARRFATMEALQMALSALGQPAPERAPPFGRLTGDQSEACARQAAHDWALRLCDRLAVGALPHSQLPDPAGGSADRSIRTGLGGVVMALAAATAALGLPQHRTALDRAAQRLAAMPAPHGQVVPGFYAGEAGIAAALLEASRLLDKPTLLDAAVARGGWIATLPTHAPDQMTGTAGRLRLHLMLWEHTADQAQLRAALAAGDALLAAAEQPARDELCWRLPAGYGELSQRVYVGYAYGVAGIADALLDLAVATGQPRFLAAAQAAARWMLRLAQPGLPDGHGLVWPCHAEEQVIKHGWEYGAAGIGQFWLHAAMHAAVPQAAELAARSAYTAARGARWSDASQGTGLAGNIELLLDMFQLTGDAAYLCEARSLAQLLRAFLAALPADAHAATPRQRIPGYLTGLAGIITCLLRLSQPEVLPGWLDRSSFRPTAVP